MEKGQKKKGKKRKIQKFGRKKEDIHIFVFRIPLLDLRSMAKDEFEGNKLHGKINGEKDKVGAKGSN